MERNETIHKGIIGIFVALYALVATISMVNSVAFFDLAHNGIMSWALAIGFELGAAASLAAIIILDRTNKNLVWALFLGLTAFQMMANSYHAYVNLEDFKGWIELFDLTRLPIIAQKRILAIVSGAVLPLVALGFIKSLVDYIRPDVEEAANSTFKGDIEIQYEELTEDQIIQKYKDLNKSYTEAALKPKEKIKLPDVEEVKVPDVQEPEENTIKEVSKQPEQKKPMVQGQIKNNQIQAPGSTPSQTEKKRITPVQGKGELNVSKDVKSQPIGAAVPNYKP